MTRVGTSEVRDQRVEARRRRGAAGGADETARTRQRAGPQFAAEQAIALVGSRQPQGAGLLGGKAEAAVIIGVADQDHGAMVAPPCRCRGVAHERAADAAAALCLL